MNSKTLFDIDDEQQFVKEFLSMYGITDYESGIAFLENNSSINALSLMRVLNSINFQSINNENYPSPKILELMHKFIKEVYGVNVSLDSIKNEILKFKHKDVPLEIIEHIEKIYQHNV